MSPLKIPSTYIRSFVVGRSQWRDPWKNESMGGWGWHAQYNRQLLEHEVAIPSDRTKKQQRESTKWVWVKSSNTLFKNTYIKVSCEQNTGMVQIAMQVSICHDWMEDRWKTSLDLPLRDVTLAMSEILTPLTAKTQGRGRAATRFRWLSYGGESLSCQMENPRANQRVDWAE